MKTLLFPIFSFAFLLLISVPGKSSDITRSGKGVVVLNDNTSHFGHLTFNEDIDLVMIEQGDKILTYSPYQVKLFQYYDGEHELNRIYTAVEISKPDAYYAHHGKKFLELVMQGDITVMREEKLKLRETYDDQDRTAILKRNLYSDPTLVVGFDYYFNKDGSTYELKNFKKQVLPLMADHQQEVERFIKENKFDLSSWEDQYEVINYYNDLKSKQQNQVVTQNIGSR